MDHDKFDEIVGNKLNETQGFPFDEAQWDSVEAQLDQKKKKRPIVWWYWGAAAAALLLLVGLAYNNLILHQKINSLEDKMASIKPTQTPLNIPIEQKPESTIIDIENSSLVTSPSKTNNITKTKENSFQQQTNRTISENQAPSSSKKPLDIIENISSSKDAVDLTIESNPTSKEKSTITVANVNKVKLETAIVDREESVLFDKLNIKENFIDEKIAALPKFESTSFKLKNKFGVNGFSTGVSGNIGWGLVNVKSDFDFSTVPEGNDIQGIGASDERNNFHLDKNESISVSTQQSSYIRWWNQLHLSKGLTIRSELGRRKIRLSAQPVLVNGAFTDDQLTAIDNAFNTQTEFEDVQNAQVIQTDWTLGLGLSYHFFRTWKIQPYLSLIPELSWNINRQESFDILDQAFESSNFSNTDSSSKVHLRSISTRSGVQGLIGKHLIWQAEFGYNIPFNIINPTLLNKYQVGLNLGYKF